MELNPNDKADREHDWMEDVFSAAWFLLGLVLLANFDLRIGVGAFLITGHMNYCISKAAKLARKEGGRACDS